MEQTRLKLTRAELDDIQQHIDQSYKKPVEFDHTSFLKDLPLYAYHLPKRLVRFLNDFKYHPGNAGYCIISTDMIEDAKLGKTPGHWQLPTNNDTCQDALITMCQCASILGDIFGWQTQQDGRMVHDVLPIEAHQNEQLGSGSEEELTWHTEDAFHELRGDYLVLMCLRNHDKVPTTISKPDYSRLTDDQLDALFSESFVIRPDHSHSLSNCATDRSITMAADGSDSDNLAEAYKAISERTKNPGKTAVLFGNRQNPSLRLDPFFMETPSCDKTKNALDALVKVVEDSLTEVPLNAGEILILDNYKVVHGRRPFRARYDGTDRWHKRINVTRDIRKCQKVLETNESRIIH